MSVLSRHSKAENGGTAVEQSQIHGCTLAQLCKVTLCRLRVPVGFPAAAAGKVPAAVFNKAHHVAQGVAQKNADLMREFGRAAQSARKLGEPGRAVGPFCRQMVALLPEKALLSRYT